MSELLTKLGIDWRLFIAQLVNFLILFFLLRKLLYSPVLRILSERRERIAKGLTDAEQATARLAGVELERAAVLHRAEVERAAMLERAAAEAETLRKERVAAADVETRAMIDRATREAERVRTELLAEIRDELGALVLTVSKKVTAEHIAPKDHEQLVAEAMRELEHVSL